MAFQLPSYLFRHADYYLPNMLGLTSRHADHCGEVVRACNMSRIPTTPHEASVTAFKRSPHVHPPVLANPRIDVVPGCLHFKHFPLAADHGGHCREAATPCYPP